MFNADKGNQKIVDRVNAMTDEFAALFAELPSRQQLAIISKMNELLDNPEAASSFAKGTYAQQSDGQPALALGSSSTPQSPAPQEMTPQQHVTALLTDGGLDLGIQNALRRIFLKDDPDHMAVGRDGTPAALTSARQTAKTEKDRADEAEESLANLQKKINGYTDALNEASQKIVDLTKERDEAKTAKAAGMIAKKDVRDRLSAIEDAWSRVEDAKFGSNKTLKQADAKQVDDSLAKINDLVS